MATPPTFIQDVEGSSWSTTTTPQSSGSFNGSLNDVLVSMVVDANDNGTENYGWTSSPAETWTEKTETTGTVGGDAWIQPATTILTAARTGMTVTVARSAGDVVPWGVDVAQFSGSDGVGNASGSAHQTAGAPSWSFTTSFANSAIVVAMGDWSAGDASTRAYRAVNGYTPTAGGALELAYFRNTTDYALCIAYYPDAGAAGAKTLGLTAPAAGSWVVSAVEVRGSSAGPPLPVSLVMPPFR